MAPVVKPIRGSQLIEVMVAVTLLGIVVAALLGVFPSAYASLGKAQARLEAETLASSLLEERRTWSWTELKLGTAPPLDPVTGGAATFKPTVEVLEVEGRSPDDLKQVRVTVVWEERGGEQRLTQSLVLVNLRG